MDSSSFDRPFSETFSEDPRSLSFRQLVTVTSAPLFAVLDGSQFDDLEDDLADAGISSRSLFLDGGDIAMRRDGPWFVRLDKDHVRDHIERLALEKACVVFWAYPDGEEALWKHLRRLNKVRVATEKGGSRDAFEWVLFRHFDPNVLAQTLPAFDEVQFSRFLGSATVLFLPADDYAERPGWHKVRRARAFSTLPKGPLTLDAATMQRIRERRSGAIRQGIKRYIRTMAADQWPVSEQDIDTVVDRSEASARELGILSGENRKKWAWLDLVSDGNFGRSPTVRAHLQRPGADHDWDINTLISLAKKELNRDGR
ncbi:DUF4123 domain-containing protein [Rhizobiales bacterium RZME27]|jgi:hypothetical protein|uniref:DUF4123 domain-containing protein n=1 Tax=Endobacterium cereale TaxID=2663029 RepID=A0A6A8ADM1_9HYPH|nr:DUF4123 domain-containing protein [Endobacterium cereale]MEB2845517.1 DUF4123 domain-containing protein [Endobacterium cereale]MQY48854.1 DUF4123 domain-containing protein [Endobacterium cereale]